MNLEKRKSLLRFRDSSAQLSSLLDFGPVVGLHIVGENMAEQAAHLWLAAKRKKKQPGSHSSLWGHDIINIGSPARSSW